ncbi:hypothetical protein RSOLAG22IIIB_00105 [Rhizoctonia solani]|uniref:RRM domain-containing protein n=1 Tax=Rhizoctonia solani TaxID=456999 RepID=A0A0K6FKY2_9AGAM|nr:unnamed protein product [Rhizoctonia solani]CUA66664.1 hypothetical protein RSOLAG22IIIB_00105 [Rhizoctonia solani]
MSTFDPSLVSRGWPFSDCAIHVQFRGDDNRNFSLDDIRQTCEGFGRILKIYVWTAKRSQKPQACVLFDSIEAVKAADRSTHSGMCRLWKSGYHMLRMCESTTMILETNLTKDGLVQGHPIFVGIPMKRAPYGVHHPPTRNMKLVEKIHRPIPTGPRYQPYSLDARPHPPRSPPRTTPPPTSFVSFPPKREVVSPNVPSVRHHANQLSFSPPRSNGLGRSFLTAAQAAPLSPTKPSPRQKSPEPLGLSQTTRTEGVGQTQTSQKLESDRREPVFTQNEPMATKLQEMEAENQKLKARLRNSEEDLALLEDTVKRVEGREQAAITLLTETEARGQEQLQSLRNSLKFVESVKNKTEIELEALKQKYGVLEAQLFSTQEQLRLFSLSRRALDRPMRAHSDSPRSGLETDKASVTEQDDICITPATDFARNPGLEKGTLQNLAGLLDAFKEIDDLVRSAFHP